MKKFVIIQYIIANNYNIGRSKQLTMKSLVIIKFLTFTDYYFF